MRYLERQILLQIIDNRWREHLYEMDYLREGIHLRGFAQIDPLVAYKNEGYNMFQELMASIWEEFVRVIFHVEVNIEPAQAEEMFGTEEPRRGGDVQYSGAGGEERPSAMREAQTGGVATAAGAAGAGAAAAPEPQTGQRSGHEPGHGRQGRDREDRPERSLLVRLGQEVQEVSRRLGVAALLAAGVIGALGAAGSATSAQRTVAISGRAYAFNHSDTGLAGAVIRVRELPQLSAVADARGRLRAARPGRHQRDPVHRAAARLPPDRPADVPHARRADRKRQLPGPGRRGVQRAFGPALRAARPGRPPAGVRDRHDRLGARTCAGSTSRRSRRGPPTACPARPRARSPRSTARSTSTTP